MRGPGLVGAVAALGLGVAHHYLWGGKDGVADGMADGLRDAGARRVDRRHRDPAVRAAERRGPVRPRRAGPRLRRQHPVGRSGHAATRTTSYAGSPPLLEMPIVPVGAAFDFWSGAVAEAPAFLHGSGLEWIYRLSREPRRLWRRYLIGNPRFLVSALRHRTT